MREANNTTHHWTGLKPNPADNFGFIYVIIDHTAGRMYIGRKQYWMSKRIKGCKSKITDKQSPKWKGSCWRESDWRVYKGSSPSFKEWQKKHPDHQYEYKIIRHCRSKGTLHYAEVEALVTSGSLWVRGSDGSHTFFNRQIPATRFRPPDFYDTERWYVEPGELKGAEDTDDTTNI